MNEGDPLTGEIRHLEVTLDDQRLHVASAGDPEGPLLVLLHGFPESWRTWKNLMESLAAEGYWLLAPDQRGYGRTGIPADRKDYSLDLLAGDVQGLIDWAERDRAVIIGHDWGGAVAWHLTLRHPERVERLVILNMPHPQAMKQALLSDPRQMARSWYIYFFQLPFLPEFILGRRRAEGLLRLVVDSARPGTFTDADLEAYRGNWTRPGAIRAMLDWYRLEFRRSVLDLFRGSETFTPVSTPTLIIWGMKDRAFRERLAAASVEQCLNAELLRIESATHWVHHEEPDRVTEAIRVFLQ